MTSQARTPGARLGEASIGFGDPLPPSLWAQARVSVYARALSMAKGAAKFTTESLAILGRDFLMRIAPMAY